jgi:hypothetical protein
VRFSRWLETAKKLIHAADDSKRSALGAANENYPVRYSGCTALSYAELASRLLGDYDAILFPSAAKARIDPNQHEGLRFDSPIVKQGIDFFRREFGRLPEFDPDDLAWELLAEWKRCTPRGNSMPSAPAQLQLAGDHVPPDGPQRPVYLWLNNKRHEYKNRRAWRVLKFFWNRQSATFEEILDPEDPDYIFTGRSNSDLTGKINTALTYFKKYSPSELPWTLTVERGHVAKRYKPKKIS